MDERNEITCRFGTNAAPADEKPFLELPVRAGHFARAAVATMLLAGSALAASPLPSAHFMVLDTKAAKDNDQVAVSRLIAQNLERRFGACVGPNPALTSADVRNRIAVEKLKAMQGKEDSAALAQLASDTVCKRGVLVTSQYSVIDGISFLDIDLLSLGPKVKGFSLGGALEQGRGVPVAELARRAVDALPDFCSPRLSIKVNAHYLERSTYSPPADDNGDIRTTLSSTHNLTVEANVISRQSSSGEADLPIGGEWVSTEVRRQVSGNATTHSTRTAGAVCGVSETVVPAGHSESMLSDTVFSNGDSDQGSASVELHMDPKLGQYKVGIWVQGFPYQATTTMRKTVRSCGETLPPENPPPMSEPQTWAGMQYGSPVGIRYEPGRYPITGSASPEPRTVDGATVTERYEWTVEATRRLWEILLKEGRI